MLDALDREQAQMKDEVASRISVRTGIIGTVIRVSRRPISSAEFNQTTLLIPSPS